VQALQVFNRRTVAPAWKSSCMLCTSFTDLPIRISRGNPELGIRNLTYIYLLTINRESKI
jgi:hypothetical protein